MQKTKMYALTTLLTLTLIITIIPLTITAVTATDSWTLVNDARDVKAYPELKEYVWQKNANAPPHTIYDRIGLHRLVKTGIIPKGVVFIIPERSASGEEYISNPPSDNLTKLESQFQTIYWANRGFDVYAIECRWHFIPNELNASQLPFMAEWSRDTWISDIKEAISKAKEVSGAEKVFIAGYSGGCSQAMQYASKYWKEDVLGIILLSPWSDYGLPVVVAKRGNETNTYNLTKALSNMTAAGNWSRQNLSVDAMLRFSYALENPGATTLYQGAPFNPAINPKTNKTWANITEYYGYQFDGKAMNYSGGMGNLTLLAYHYSYRPVGERWVPQRFYLEDDAMMDWVNCPYLSYDFDDHYKEINVPILAFIAGTSQNPTGTFRFVNGIGSTDFTGVMLKNYCHYDVFFGTYSARDVSQPALNWMNGQLTGLKASAFCNVTLVGGGTWWFFTHSNGGVGTHTYQWYEGTTQLQGQTSMVLPATKNTPGIYTYYCKITDSEGTTTNSNNVTLTVLS